MNCEVGVEIIDKPWHGLGVQVPWLMTTEEALLAANLDWQVSKIPLLSSYDLSTVSGHYLTVRSDTMAQLGVVRTRYQPVSNREAFEFFDIALGTGQGQIDTAGALGRGERVWMMAKMPETMEVVPGDPVERYLLVSTSHDGSNARAVVFTNIRVVCANTLNAALRYCSNKVSIRHTTNIEAKMSERNVLSQTTDALAQVFDKLSHEVRALQPLDKVEREFLAKSNSYPVQGFYGATLSVLFKARDDGPCGVNSFR